MAFLFVFTNWPFRSTKIIRVLINLIEQKLKIMVENRQIKNLIKILICTSRAGQSMVFNRTMHFIFRQTGTLLIYFYIKHVNANKSLFLDIKYYIQFIKQFIGMCQKTNSIKRWRQRLANIHFFFINLNLIVCFSMHITSQICFRRKLPMSNSSVSFRCENSTTTN